MGFPTSARCPPFEILEGRRGGGAINPKLTLNELKFLVEDSGAPFGVLNPKR